jgi:putative ABC transport system substrate-binding protein
MRTTQAQSAILKSGEGGHMRRRDFITFLGGAATAWPIAARAQQARMTRIGFLGPTSYFGMQERMENLRAGLRDLGYVEGDNLNIDFRWAEGRYDRLPALAAELVHLKVDVIVSATTPATLAAKQATTTIPIVMAATGDAVANGLVDSLNRPGGNITGSSFYNPEVSAKRLELIREAAPRATQIGNLLNAGNQSLATLKSTESAAAALHMKLHQFPVRGPSELAAAFMAMAGSSIEFLAVDDEAMLTSNAKTIAELAARQRLPSIGGRELAEAGGLIGYGANVPALYRRAATFVDKLIKGAKPADLPVELPTRFDLVISLKTAKAIGLEVPPLLLARADQVID